MRDRYCFRENEVYEELDNVNKLMERTLIFRSLPREVTRESFPVNQMVQVNLEDVEEVLRILPLERAMHE